MSAVSRKTEIALGLCGLLAYGVHAAYYLPRRQGENLLWFCHLAALGIGVALLMRKPTLNAIGLLWLTVGTPCWFLYLAGGGALLPGAVLTHSALLLSLLGVRQLGLPRDAWWKAVLALVVVFAVTRLVTPPAANVNLAFAIWPGWERFFPSHLVYLTFLALVSGATFFAVSRGLRRSGLAPAAEPRSR
jgi:hypothetical protein